MAYKTPAKRKYRRKRSYRKGKAPLSKRQYSAVKKLTIRQIMGTRETKIRYTQLDPTASTINLQNGNGLLENTLGYNAFNLTNTGESGNERSGLQIQAMNFSFLGHCKVNASTGLSQQTESLVRIVWGFVKEPLSLTNPELMRNGQYNVGIPTGIAAIYKPFNWNIFRPIKQQVFKMAPSHLYTDGVGAPVNQLQTVPDGKILRFNHSFGRKGKQMVYKDDTNSYANADNIVCLVICRNMNDSVVATQNLKFFGTTNFRYTDA